MGGSLSLLVGCRVGSEGGCRNSSQILRKERVSGKYVLGGVENCLQKRDDVLCVDLDEVNVKSHQNGLLDAINLFSLLLEEEQTFG